MNFSEPIAYIISQLTVLGKALVEIVKIMISISVVIFDLVSQLLKLASNQ